MLSLTCYLHTPLLLQFLTVNHPSLNPLTNRVHPPLLVITPLKLNPGKNWLSPENVKIELTHTVNDFNAALSNTRPSNLNKKIPLSLLKTRIISFTEQFPSTNSSTIKASSPPAFETRKRDGAVCTSKKTFNSSYILYKNVRCPLDPSRLFWASSIGLLPLKESFFV